MYRGTGYAAWSSAERLAATKRRRLRADAPFLVNYIENPVVIGPPARAMRRGAPARSMPGQAPVPGRGPPDRERRRHHDDRAMEHRRALRLQDAGGRSDATLDEGDRQPDRLEVGQ